MAVEEKEDWRRRRDVGNLWQQDIRRQIEKAKEKKSKRKEKKLRDRRKRDNETQQQDCSHFLFYFATLPTIKKIKPETRREARERRG